MESIQSELQIQKKWSMGKYLRKQKGLYKPEPQFSYAEPTPTQNTLFSNLKAKGFLSSKVAHAEFSLKNGLHYSGLIATEEILTHDVFFQIPKEMILNTKIAYFSEIRSIFEENSWDFIIDNNLHADYILLFFILFEYQKGKDSEWYHYISTLPKDQGFLALWDEEDIEHLEDEAIKTYVIKEKQNIFKDYDRLSKIALKYPKFFRKETFSLENFIWIYSILTNRSFLGDYKYVSMIPFVDMVNHNCVDVYRNHPHNDEAKEKEEEGIHQRLSQEDEDEFSSSENTEDEKDYDGFNEFEAVEKEAIIKNLLIRKVVNWFQEKVDFNDLTSLAFLGRLISFIEEKERENEEFNEIIIKICEDYLKSLQEFYLVELKTEYKKNNCVKPQVENKKNYVFDPKKQKWEPEGFDKIEFAANMKENFSKNSQVFICYGVYSNKRLLKNYGMSIEFNKYDKVFLNISPSNFYQESDDFSNFLMLKKCFPFLKQFKLKYTEFNTNLIVFFKLLMFDFEKNQINDIFYAKDINLEIKAVEKIIFFLKGLNFSKNSLEENEKLLFDKNIGYNHYFSVIYKLEKQRITQLNIKLFNICLIMLHKMQKGLNKFQVFSVKIESEENEEEFLRHRYILSPYIKKWEF